MHLKRIQEFLNEEYTYKIKSINLKNIYDFDFVENFVENNYYHFIDYFFEFIKYKDAQTKDKKYLDFLFRFLDEPENYFTSNYNDKFLVKETINFFNFKYKSGSNEKKLNLILKDLMKNYDLNKLAVYPNRIEFEILRDKLNIEVIKNLGVCLFIYVLHLIKFYNDYNNKIKTRNEYSVIMDRKSYLENKFNLKVLDDETDSIILNIDVY